MRVRAGGIGQRSAVSHRDEIARAEKNVGFTVGDAVFNLLCGTGNHEERISIAFHLRALVCFLGIFNGQVMQAELFLKQGKHFVVRLVQADPDKAAIVDFQRFADIFDMDSAALAIFRVNGAIDDTSGVFA